jgi:hypothetical protein
MLSWLAVAARLESQPINTPHRLFIQINEQSTASQHEGRSPLKPARSRGVVEIEDRGLVEFEEFRLRRPGQRKRSGVEAGPQHDRL